MAEVLAAVANLQHRDHRNGCATRLAPEVVVAYDAPFPDESDKEGARNFVSLVPTGPGHPAAEANRRAWTTLETWGGPVLTALRDKDAVTAGGDRPFLRLPGAHGQAHVTVAGGGHFLAGRQGRRSRQHHCRIHGGEPVTERFEIAFLGTGSPLPNADRCGAGQVVAAGNTNVMVDCGWGAARKLRLAGRCRGEGHPPKRGDCAIQFAAQ